MIVIERPDWQQHAACRGMGFALFFPKEGEPADEAKRVCARCPVMLACRQMGLNEKFGIFGGLSEKQRRRVRREPNLTVRGAA